MVPDNTNNTLGAAVTVLETASGAVVPATAAGTPANASNVADGIQFTLSLKSGTQYTIVTAVVTLRDAGCAGTVADTAKCSGPIEEFAVAHAASLARPGALAAAFVAQRGFWERYWAASSIDITGGNGGPNATEVEKWYYGMQWVAVSSVPAQLAATRNLRGLGCEPTPEPRVASTAGIRSARMCGRARCRRRSAACSSRWTRYTARPTLLASRRAAGDTR